MDEWDASALPFVTLIAFVAFNDDWCVRYFAVAEFIAAFALTVVAIDELESTVGAEASEAVAVLVADVVIDAVAEMVVNAFASGGGSVISETRTCGLF